MNRFVIAAAFALLLPALQAANWPNWRGPTGNGVAPAGSYPMKWNQTDNNEKNENIAWRIALPGRGASTPIVWQRQIFLTYGKEGKNVLAAFDWNGKLQWEATVGNERVGKHKKATGSNPSAATDGQSVFTYFKSGDLACVDLDGKVKWQQNLQDRYGEDTLWWDLGTSPVLTEDAVVVAVMQTGPSYLVAFDKQTGEQRWMTQRNVQAPEEAAQSYSTPIVTRDAAGNEVIYVLGADHITSHNAADGKEIWRVGGLNPTQQKFYRSIASPVLAGDLLIAPYARGSTLTAVKLGGQGDVTKTHVAWFRDDLGADVPTPTTDGKRVYVCTDKGEVACLDVKSGDTIWRQQVEKHRAGFSSSPILADGKIYATREDGKTFVLRQGDKYELLATNQLQSEMTVATPVFVDGRILLRTVDYLYAIGTPSESVSLKLPSTNPSP